MHNPDMNRHYRKSRHDPGLFEIATTSDWKITAAMAAVCVLNPTRMTKLHLAARIIFGTFSST